jgi:hypothetical protein
MVQETSKFSRLLLTLPNEVIDVIFVFFNPYKFVLYRIVMIRMNRMAKFLYIRWMVYKEIGYATYQFSNNGKVFTIMIDYKRDYENEKFRIKLIGYVIRSAIVRSTKIVLKNFKHKNLKPLQTHHCWWYNDYVLEKNMIM